MNAKKTYKELEQQIACDRIVDIEREKSDKSYAPIEVKAWVIYLVVLFIGAAAVVWQKLAGLK